MRQRERGTPQKQKIKSNRSLKTGSPNPSPSPKRRKREAWTEEETQVLAELVEKYGAGKWTAILEAGKTVFHPQRTNIDLKDKYQNEKNKMTRTSLEAGIRPNRMSKAQELSVNPKCPAKERHFRAWLTGKSHDVTVYESDTISCLKQNICDAFVDDHKLNSANLILMCKQTYQVYNDELESVESLPHDISELIVIPN